MIFWVSLFLPFFLFLNVAEAFTLDQAYQSAIDKTASVKEKVLAVEVAKQQQKQATGSVLPSLSATSTRLWRDEANVGAFGEGSQKNSFLSLSQPLFQGGAEYYSLKAARLLPKVADLNRTQAKLDLYYQVAQKFYQFLLLQAEKRNLTEQETSLRQRVSFLTQRARIGRNKKTDLLSASSQRARVQANLASLEIRVIEAQKELLTITGLDSLPELREKTSFNHLQIPSLWEENLMQSPQVQIDEMNLRAREYEYHSTKAAFLPKLDVDANYYIERAGILEDSKWDVTLTASWELFDGRVDLAEKKIKSLQKQTAELRLRDLRRSLKNDFIALKKEVLLQKEVLKKLDRAVLLARKNYKTHVSESRKGLVNNLDVLRALDEYLQIKQTYDTQYYQAKIDWVKLQTMAGVLP